MPPKNPVTKVLDPKTIDPKIIAEELAALKSRHEAAKAIANLDPAVIEARQKDQIAKKEAQKQRDKLDSIRKRGFERRFVWTFVFWSWVLWVHVVGIALFTSGFLLTRLVLDNKSECSMPPPLGSPTSPNQGLLQWPGMGTVEGGCWFPKTFERAVIVVIDALRYDFTVPIGHKDTGELQHGPQIYHNAFTFLYDQTVKEPRHAVLRPFIADPPTTTLQRLKGLTTGTLPTFVDMGSNFAGTAIEEDNLLMQLKHAGKKIAHLGDDTWESLFPGYFEPNISKAYDSFNVWDLHTVDTGVLAHIFPLLAKERRTHWDVLIAHFLGVDHAGHRYGPDHQTMRAKLHEMNDAMREIVAQLDDDTLLVVMGDHGMDSKGDHGGESNDEVEAALWLFSKRPVFGRTSAESALPPPTAKVRPVNQIDLVPTLALLLGLPIPYNNLGKPIEEAFAGVEGNAWDRLAAASEITSAGIQRYLGSYFEARALSKTEAKQKIGDLWTQARRSVASLTPLTSTSESWDPAVTSGWIEAYTAFTRHQQESLRMCKDFWARFDVPSMIVGITVMLLGLLTVLLYVSRDCDEDADFDNLDDEALGAAESMLELIDEGKHELPSYQTSTKTFTFAALSALIPTLVGAVPVAYFIGLPLKLAIACPTIVSIGNVMYSMLTQGNKTLLNLVPRSVWGWMSVAFTLSQAFGFASNSYTIWEDQISLFFLTTFGIANIARAFNMRTTSNTTRALAIYQSIIFISLSRAASVSKLCREEQMPWCTSTYYATTASSTSSTWQLFVPLMVASLLPTVVKGFLSTSRSYDGVAPAWVGVAFRAALFLIALYWAVDAAEAGAWYPDLPAHTLKQLSVALARLVLAVGFVVGTTAFVWATPCVSVRSRPDPKDPTRSLVTILGYGNVHGARFLLLVLNVVTVCMLFTKPMGVGALGMMLWQVMCLVDILDLNGLTGESIGPVVLALLGNFYFFKTGHQAVLSSVQWDAAFVAFPTVQYPWSPISVALNTFAGQVVAAAAVPLVVMWKVDPRRRGVLEAVGRQWGTFVAFFAVQATATMCWAGWLRRHLMLYRVFSPRFMLATALLLVVDLVGMVVVMLGTRANELSVGEVFGWAD